MIQRFRGHSPIIHPAARLAANATLVGCVTVEASLQHLVRGRAPGG